MEVAVSQNTRFTLIQKLQDSQDELAWEEFVRLYRGYIFAIARNMNLAPSDCDDICQTVLVKVWKKIGDFSHDGHPGRFRGWLTTVTRNSVLHLIDKRKRAMTKLDNARQIEERSYLSAITLPEVEQIGEREWAVHVSNLAWKNIEGSLTDTMKAVFQLSLDGLSRTEIAEQLDLPANTVSVYKGRVVSRMRREIQWLDAELS
jgi:RNA polymerase sigma factor (sigma-70 family)